MLPLSSDRTALLVMDLQASMGSATVAPRPLPEVVATAARLVAAAREAGVQVLFIRVGTSSDGLDWPSAPINARAMRIPAEGMEPLEGLTIEEADLVVQKRQWAAFYGTDLDLQLRRRGIDTLVMCGVMTNFVVEGTAREGWQRGYRQLFVQDAIGAPTEEMHTFSVTTILPLLGDVVDADAIVAGFQPSASAPEAGA